jgi:PTS system glucitol/sorbitol-specific IIA component
VVDSLLKTYDVVLESVVVEVGNETKELIEGGIFIFFGENVPLTLKPYCIIHKVKIAEPIKVGDILQIGDTISVITRIGEVANKNFLEIFHLVIKGEDSSQGLLPGDIRVKGELPKEIEIGQRVFIFRKKFI